MRKRNEYMPLKKSRFGANCKTTGFLTYFEADVARIQRVIEVNDSKNQRDSQIQLTGELSTVFRGSLKNHPYRQPVFIN